MPSTETTYASLISLISNASLSCLKILTGVIGSSYAMIADGIESLADSLSSIIIWNGLRIGSKKPDTEHPYGHGKAEAIATLLAGIGLWISGAIIASQAIHEIINKHEPPESFTIPILIGIIVIKELLYRFLSKQAKEHDSAALMAEALHHRSDMLTSICVLFGLCIAVFAGTHYALVDNIVALLVTGLIFKNGWAIIRPAIDELMDSHISGERFIELRSIIEKTPGVINIEKLWIHRSGRRFHVEVHLEVNPKITVKEGHEIAHHVKDRLIKNTSFQIGHVHTHVEPFEGLITNEEQ